MILPPPGFAQPIPDPSWDQLTEQEFGDIIGRPPPIVDGKPYEGVRGRLRGVRIVEDREA